MKLHDLFPSKDPEPVLTVAQVVEELLKLPQDSEFRHVCVGDYGVYPVTEICAEVSGDAVEVQF